MWERDLHERLRQAIDSLSTTQALASSMHYVAHNQLLGIRPATIKRLERIMGLMHDALFKATEALEEVLTLVKEGVK